MNGVGVAEEECWFFGSGKAPDEDVLANAWSRDAFELNAEIAYLTLDPIGDHFTARFVE